MDQIFAAAIAVLVMVALVALLWSNRVREKENYMTEGMCLGILLGAGLRSLLNLDLGVAIFVGMLLGALVGRQIGKEKKDGKNIEQKTADKEDSL